MGNGQSTPSIASLIPGLAEIEEAITNLQRLISQVGSLPDNIISLLIGIRDRLLQIVENVQENIQTTTRNIRNTVAQVQERFNTVAQQILARIDNVAQGVDTTVDQISDLLSEIGPTIPILRELIESLEDVPKVIDNLPSLLIAGAMSLLLVIAISILLYKFILEGTARLGIDHLLVLGAMIILLSVLLLLIFLYLKSQLRIILT